MSSFKLKNKNANPSLSKADIDFYKMTGVFAIACVFVLLTMRMEGTMLERIASGENLTYNFYRFFNSIAFVIVAAVALIGALVWFVAAKVKKVDESKRLFTSTNCLSVVLYMLFFSVCLGYKMHSNLHGFFIASTVVLAALYVISKIYDLDFVLYSGVSGLLTLTLYLAAGSFESAFVALQIVVSIISVALIIAVRTRINALRVSKKKKQSYFFVPSYIACVLGIVFLFCRFFTYDVAALQFINASTMIMVMCAQYIVFAIIYTIRLIRE